MDLTPSVGWRSWWPRLKLRWRATMLPVGRALARTGISPNGFTAIGLALTLGAALVIASGSYAAGAIAFLVASAFDAVDGAVARASAQSTRFGAFLDSVADRYAEAAVFFGLLASPALRADLALAAAAFLALVGSLMVSYARARAEGLGVDCEVGLLQRPERVLALATGLLWPDMLLGPVLWLLAVITNLTVVQRALHVRRTLREQGQP